MSRRRVLLLPSQEIGWSALRNTLRQSTEFKIIGEASHNAEAVELVRQLGPDLIFSAGIVEGEPIFSVLEQARSAAISHDPRKRHLVRRPQVVLLSQSFPAEHLPRMAAIGVAGYLLWEDITEAALAGCLALTAAPNFIVLSRRVAQAFAEMRVGKHSPLHADRHPTDRERVVLQALARGESERVIAANEHISVRTVQRVIEELKVKYEAPSLFVLGIRAASGEITGWS